MGLSEVGRPVPASVSAGYTSTGHPTRTPRRPPNWQAGAFRGLQGTREGVLSSRVGADVSTGSRWGGGGGVPRVTPYTQLPPLCPGDPTPPSRPDRGLLSRFFSSG